MTLKIHAPRSTELVSVAAASAFPGPRICAPPAPEFLLCPGLQSAARKEPIITAAVGDCQGNQQTPSKLACCLPAYVPLASRLPLLPACSPLANMRVCSNKYWTAQKIMDSLCMEKMKGLKQPEWCLLMYWNSCSFNNYFLHACLALRSLCSPRILGRKE